MPKSSPVLTLTASQQMHAALLATRPWSNIYWGTVPDREVRRRRKANKVARRQNRLNRKH